MELDLEDRVSNETYQLFENNQENKNNLRIIHLCNCIYRIFAFFKY